MEANLLVIVFTKCVKNSHAIVHRAKTYVNDNQIINNMLFKTYYDVKFNNDIVMV